MNLWIADSRALPLAEDFHRMLNRIPPEAAQKALRYVHEADRIRSAAGAFLMHSVAQKALRSAGQNEPVRFVRTEYGKPVIENHPELHLSLSHSGSLRFGSKEIKAPAFAGALRGRQRWMWRKSARCSRRTSMPG